MAGEDNKNDVAAGGSGGSGYVAQAVSIKPPAFSETSPALWFKIVEAQFSIRGISQTQTKYYHALANLPTEILDNVPPEIIEGENYDDLREAVISFYEQTKPELFAKLISSTGMTGRPSAYLRRLQQVASKVKVGEDLVRHQFIKSLPSTIAPVVAAQSSLSLTQLGAMSDELMPLHSQINNVNNEPKSPATRDFVCSNSNHGNSNPRHNQSSHPGLRPFHPDQKPKIYRGHIFYADNSRTCKSWCKYPNKNNCSVQPSSRSSSRASSRSSSPVSRNSRQMGN